MVSLSASSYTLARSSMDVERPAYVADLLAKPCLCVAAQSDSLCNHDIASIGTARIHLRDLYSALADVTSSYAFKAMSFGWYWRATQGPNSDEALVLGKPPSLLGAATA